MKKLYLYLFYLSFKFILINLLIILIIVTFLNIVEVSRIINKNDLNLLSFLHLISLKLPTIISEIIPFVIIISISFLFRNLISNNELISIRNMGFSIIDIYKPIALCIFLVGVFILLIINPISAKFEREYDRLTSNDLSNMYSIKFINKGMWIKNITNKDSKNFINIKEINLNTMLAKKINILNIDNNMNKFILAEEGKLENKTFNLKKVKILQIKTNKFIEKDNYELNVNFNKMNIIDSISDFKFIPFYRYKEHINNLKKFNLHSSEITLYYLSEILKPFFLVVIGFVVMGFSGKFKKNENFFKILFIAILIGFLIFLFKEMIISLTILINIPFFLSYFIIFIFPFVIGLYQVIKIERD